MSITGALMPLQGRLIAAKYRPMLNAAATTAVTVIATITVGTFSFGTGCRLENDPMKIANFSSPRYKS